MYNINICYSFTSYIKEMVNISKFSQIVEAKQLRYWNLFPLIFYESLSNTCNTISACSENGLTGMRFLSSHKWLENYTKYMKNFFQTMVKKQKKDKIHEWRQTKKMSLQLFQLSVHGNNTKEFKWHLQVRTINISFIK